MQASMGTIHKSDDELSYMKDKGDIGFIDLDYCKSVCSYNPSEESQIVQISVPFSLVNGKPRSGFVGETIYDSITIGNITDESLDLWSVSIYDSKPENTFTISLMEPPNVNSDELYIQDFVEASALEDRVLRTDEPLTIWLSCKPKEIGLHSAAVHFSVGDETIERLVFVLAEDKISQSLSSTKPFYRPRKKKLNTVVDVHATDVAYVVGRRPSRGSNRGFTYRLPNYPIPQDIRDMVNSKQIPDVVADGLTKNKHSSFFNTLLAMEEIKLEEDMRAYDMEFVSLKGRRNKFLCLEVPGLAERRPSLVNGDFIFAKLASEAQNENVAYQGYIHRVEAEEIYLQFDQDFHRSHIESNLYHVQFTYNRNGMRRLYQAVEAAESLSINFLFPSLAKFKLVQPAPLVPISCTLNEEQLSAVEMIIACKGESPYVIHGPPGTGKTITLIEAILQIYTTSRKNRILICAPSNSAADHILERLIDEKSAKIEEREIFRLNAFTRPFEDVNPDHIKFCHVEDSMFKCPSCWELQKFRIIISTYTSASLLYSEGIKRGHFSYIFLDEAGQASEPETMVPLSQVHSRGTVVVLAGDPMQLGPVLVSKDAESYGLGTSYLERLLKNELYSCGNRKYMTRLVRNYRTHPAILHLPSELFYDGELIPCKEEDSGFLMPLEDLLPNKEFPLLFLGIQGCDEREGSNPSWFNRIEASKVVEISRFLTEQKGIKEEAIGVITPYRQQVLKIRGALEGLGKPNIKVGSVEQFQGQERQVIIISTVRSTVKHNEFDRVHYLGFLSNPKRFNVSITRARSLLIVIGNPHILCKDPYWNKILWYCVDNDSYKGCFLPEREELSVEAYNSQPLVGQWGQEANNWEPSNAQWGEERVNSESSKDQWGDEGNNGQWGDGRNNGQWDDERNDWEPSNGQWGDEGNHWEPSKDQWHEEKSDWEPSNSQWRKDSKDQWGKEKSDSEPYEGQWGDEKSDWKPSNAEWGDKKSDWEPSNAQWSNEKSDFESSNPKQSKEKIDRKPSNAQWGDEKSDWESSNAKRGKGKNDQKPSSAKCGEKKSEWKPSNAKRGKEKKDQKPSSAQWGEKQNDSEPSKGQKSEGDNWEPPSQVKLGVEEISNQLSYMSWRDSVKDIQPTGWE